MRFPQVAPSVPDPAERTERPAILLVSQDVALSETRAALLRRIGFDVTIALYHHACLKLVRNDFALVVLCQTIREEQALSLVAMMRGVQQHAIAVRLTLEPSPTAGCYDQTFLAPVPPELLTEQITKFHTLPRA